MDLVHQRYAVVEREEFHVPDQILISVFQVSVNADQLEHVVQVRQIHVTELATVARASVVPEAPVKQMKSALLACVTVVPIRHVKLPQTLVTEPIACAALPRNVLEMM